MLRTPRTAFFFLQALRNFRKATRVPSCWVPCGNLQNCAAYASAIPRAAMPEHVVAKDHSSIQSSKRVVRLILLSTGSGGFASQRTAPAPMSNASMLWLREAGENDDQVIAGVDLNNWR